jgi:lipopolysaccharide/colanic/teichoic acid biosynthesis glycosyltransferase
MNNPRSSFPVWKRIADIAMSSAALIVLFPLLVLIAAVIRIVSHGPAFLRQERVGRYGKTFGLWKFRTMHVGADVAPHRDHLESLITQDIPMIKLDMADDPRVFPFGKFLRRTCMDELPQLFNVLRGEMSLVGPRPCLPYEVAHYDDWHMQRFEAMPGLTGLWQVSGKNKTTFSEMIRLDIAYLTRVSPVVDLKILLKTIPAILADERRTCSSYPQFHP